MLSSDHQNLAPGFLNSLVWIIFLGAIGLIGGNIIGSIVVPDHDWVADTVSDLAAGRYEIIQDISLYGFAATLTALALACAHLHNGSARWSLLTFALVLLALCVVIIGARNEYGDGDNDGIVIHIYVVYALGILFAAAFALMAVEGARIAPFMVPLSWVCLILWAIGAPVFFMLSTAFDGAWERGLGVITVVWALGFAFALRQFARKNSADA
ncbi:putative membrane protein [Sulfitobacter noctilucae]|uniref:DUF998 domain-containing protein n=1 Tax=Sulfitobacter noctilucae TaxID=1342302 RepID=UPI00046B06B4|nr:DUF998 domain-containing protein [Sulfitobacter noctilucae]KIN70735.1 putative membrane protein [Sulfitobacter noctilucae]